MFFHCRCGLGVLTYGFGSKKSLLENFASTTLTNMGVIVVNGYLPSVNLKQVLLALVGLWWTQAHIGVKGSGREGPCASLSMEDLISLLERKPPKDVEKFICLVVNNIDGPGLRDAEAQQWLGRIAACSSIRIVASLDHVNAPLCKYLNLSTGCR